MSGNAYVELVDASGARELHLLRPDRVAVVADASGWPVALEHREGAGKRRIQLASEGEGGALHMTLFHPLDDHYGFPPLQAALMALDIHNAAGRWNKALLDNSARPSGALVYAPKEGGNLTEEQFGRIKEELEQGYSGAARAGRPLLLEGGLDWKAMGLTPKDMDFIEAKNAASRDIALAFGVPPMLLGIPGDNTYSNYQEANRAFYRGTVLPLAARSAGAFTAWLAPLFGERLRLSCDPDGVEGLSADRTALWQRIGAADFLTDDEKREAVGYGPRG
jgi:HK97 family phage portal protein